MQEGEKNLILSAIHILGHEFHENSRNHGFWPKKKQIEYRSIEDIRIEHDSLCANNIYCQGHDREIEINEVDVNARNKGEMIALMHTELSEALEGIRKPHQDEHCQSQYPWLPPESSCHGLGMKLGHNVPHCTSSCLP